MATAVDTVMSVALVPLESWNVATDVAVIGMDLTADTNIVTGDTCPLAPTEYYLLLSPFPCEMAILFYRIFSLYLLYSGLTVNNPN